MIWCIEPIHGLFYTVVVYLVIGDDRAIWATRQSPYNLVQLRFYELFLDELDRKYNDWPDGSGVYG